MFKINIGSKEGKTYKLELDTDILIGKNVGEKITGKGLLADLGDYEFEIKGASDKAGFMAHQEVEGVALKKILLPVGQGMHKRPKGDKKKNQRTKKGLRLRKTVRGKVISPEIIQVNLKVSKAGAKPLTEIFSSQEKKEEASQETAQ